ncbi:hypothetical protein R5R35_006848 [Gryllus longicercus]|uniref:Mos1 transposase HTH domain-containing protein n=1 Tax=Gryllus longicercus TaxID=2509291 RepID=A0AAN9YVJ0_9ORTH
MSTIDVRLNQRAVIEFLNSEGQSPICIHERLKKFYADATVDVSTVRRWIRRCTGVRCEEQLDMADAPRSGRPHTAMTADNIQRVDDIIRENRRVPTSELLNVNRKR